jgi:hypothetical protein
MHHRSREAMSPPSFEFVPLDNERGAERRQALGCSGTLTRASNVGPQAPLRTKDARERAFARRLASPRRPACAVGAAGGRSPLGAPPRRFFGSDLPWRNRQAVPSSLALAHSRVPLVVAEGQCCRTPPGGCLQGNPQDAASRSAYAMPRESTLGERDGRTIVLGRVLSTLAARVHRLPVGIVLIATAHKRKNA